MARGPASSASAAAASASAPASASASASTASAAAAAAATAAAAAAAARLPSLQPDRPLSTPVFDETAAPRTPAGYHPGPGPEPRHADIATSQ